MARRSYSLLLTADESALAGGLVPRSLLTYSPGIVPVPLVVATGITETAVAARELERLSFSIAWTRTRPSSSSTTRT